MTRFLIRLYPAAWRTRYGDEFEALLEERPLGPFDVADVLLAAIDAHLSLRGLGAASQRQRSFTMSLRLGGLAAIAGGPLILAGFVAGSGIFGSDAQFAAGALFLAGTAALLIALIGLSSFQARRHPRLIWTAFAIPAVGTVVSCVGLVAMAIVGDRPLVAGLSPWYVWFTGLIAMIVGSAVFAVATYRTRALSRTAAGLLAGGSGLLLAIFALGFGGMVPTDPLAPALMFAGMLAFSGGWIALGWAAVRLDRPAAATA